VNIAKLERDHSLKHSLERREWEAKAEEPREFLVKLSNRNPQEEVELVDPILSTFTLRTRRSTGSRKTSCSVGRSGSDLHVRLPGKWSENCIGNAALFAAADCM
jgi:hypothetical protein